MAHKTLVNGTAYEVSSGRTLVGGTGYDITGGRTLVGGTGYDISFGPEPFIIFEAAESTKFADQYVGNGIGVSLSTSGAGFNSGGYAYANSGKHISFTCNNTNVATNKFSEYTSLHIMAKGSFRFGYSHTATNGSTDYYTTTSSFEASVTANNSVYTEVVAPYSYAASWTYFIVAASSTTNFTKVWLE